MQLTINGKKYTFCYTIAATLCDDLLENVVAIAGAANGDEESASLVIAGRLPKLTKALFYGGILQMHGEDGDNTVKSAKDADRLLKQYMQENDGKREGTLIYIFNALYEQMGQDNFLSRIGITGEEEKVTPISKGKKADGGEA